MKTVALLARKELASFFDSLMAYLILAAFLGIKRKVVRALSAFMPRTTSATRRAFCGEIRMYFATAEVSIV